MEGKIFGVGFQKTGTSTLGRALEILDYSVRAETPAALIPILKGDQNWIRKYVSRFDALEDTPWYMIYEDLDRLFPGSKFILTLRDEESWYKSVCSHIRDLRSAHHEWIYGKGKGLPKDDKANALKIYNTHNNNVLDYFKDRSEDLLLLDFTKGDQWEELCLFLGKEVPEIPFPHLNKGADNKLFRPGFRWKFKLFRKRLKNSFKIWYVTRMGYL